MARSVRRGSVVVREAGEHDLPALVALAAELRDAVAGADAASRARGSAEALHDRYREVLAAPDRTLVVATGPDDVPLGMALLTVASANPLLDSPAVHVSHSVVARRGARRGVGKALVGAAVAFAEERGLDEIVVSVPPAARESNRFFARLGFAPLVVRRVAPVAVVRRRLAAAELPAAAVHRHPRRALAPSSRRAPTPGTAP